MTFEAISSNHFSFDQQVQDAVWFWSASDPATFDVMSFRRDFPEWDHLVWDGSWVDTEASKVDPEYMHWVANWLETHTLIYWVDGEPWIETSD